MAIVLILYKPVSRAMKAAKVLPSKEQGMSTAAASTGKKKSLATSLVVLGLGLALVAISVTVFILVLGGSITLA